jgi:choline kinase
MRAVILAAGRGTRLGAITAGAPKCLVRIGDATLLERQIGTLRRCGITAITVVIGWQAEAVASVCQGAAATLENRQFAETNSLYSLWLARHLLTEGFVVLNADVLFHPQLLMDLLTARQENALLVSYVGSGGPMGEEEMKVQVRKGLVARISKQLPADEADGENVGIAKFGAEGGQVISSCLDRIVAAGGLRDWAPNAFQDFALAHPLHVVGTRGLPWIEIDYPEDYRRAVTDVLPAIERRRLWPMEDLTPPAMPPRVGGDNPIADWRPRTGHV